MADVTSLIAGLTLDMPTNCESMEEGETSLGALPEVDMAFGIKCSKSFYFFDQRNTRSFKRRKKVPEELPSKIKLLKSNSYLANSVKSINKNGVSTDEDKVELLRKPQRSKLCKLGQKASETHMKDRKVSRYDDLKHMAPSLLQELSDLLFVCSKYEITITQGVVNVINYSWKELIESAEHTNMHFQAEEGPLHLGLAPEENKTSGARSIPLQKADSVMKLKSKKMLEENWKKNSGQHIATDHLSPNKLRKTLPRSKSFTIHFSLASETCESREWIIQTSKPEPNAMELKGLLTRAVMRLQLTLMQINKQSEYLEAKGWTKPVVLRHYIDIKSTPRVPRGKHQKTRTATFKLDGRNSVIPELKQEQSSIKKLHYALIDGSSMVYYPSGQLAVCQSNSGLLCGGLYTSIFSPNETMLGAFTPFGHGSITDGSHIVLHYNNIGGEIFSKEGNIVREWKWPHRGKLSNPVTVQVNENIFVKIVSHFNITLIYTWQHENVNLSLTPLLNTSPPQTKNLDSLMTDVCFSSRTATDICRVNRKRKEQKSTILPSSTKPVEIPKNTIEASTEFRKLKKQAHYIADTWMEQYRLALAPLLLLPVKQSATENIINTDSLLNGRLTAPVHNQINYLDTAQIPAPSRLKKMSTHNWFSGNESQNK